MKYRPDIDGLRAVAIVPVVLYHLKIELGGGYFLPGGFLGVDIFFVISGFLITSILLREEAAAGRISIPGFYLRRIRRIIPTLLLVILATAGAGWMIMLPTELERLGQSMVAAMAFYSNIFWYYEPVRYGAGPALEQPMLHTWSLAIEEQFYLVFPFLVLLLRPATRPRIAMIAFLVLLSGSFAISQATSILAPKMSFLSPASRAWELLFGSVLALVMFRVPHALRPNKRMAIILPKVALLTLVLSMILVVLPDVFHPGLVTLPTVLATGVLICCADPDEAVTRALSWGPVAYIGRLSYAIYLWHVPVFAMGRLLAEGSPDPTTMSGWVALTLLLSIASHHLVERPVKGGLRTQPLSAAITLAVAACAVFIYTVTQTDLSSRGRYNHLLEAYGQNEIDNELLRRASWTLLDTIAGPAEEVSKANARVPSSDESNRLWFPSDERTKLLFVGNSHAKDIFNALYLSEAAQKQVAVARFGVATQFPADQIDQLLHAPNFHAADWIVIATRFDHDFEEPLADLIHRIKARGKRVAIVGNTAEFTSPGERPIFDWYIARNAENVAVDDMSRIAWNARDKTRIELDQDLRQFAKEAGAPFLSRHDLICRSAARSCAMVTDQGMKTMYDYSHWTLEGAAHFGDIAVESGWLSPLAN